jgi:putative Holliday junction resolvase
VTARRRILAVDYGARRTGLAATDPTGTIVVPLPALHLSDPNACADAVVALAAERASDTIVVGLPLAADGGIGERARHTLAFVELLRARTPREVVTVDESGTTDEAHARLKAGGLRAARRRLLADSVAAIVILERYRGS